jgi:hypothetical protein
MLLLRIGTDESKNLRIQVTYRVYFNLQCVFELPSKSRLQQIMDGYFETIGE